MTGVLATAVVALASTLAAILAARRLPWSDAARAAWLPETAGFAAAPLLVGLVVVALLWLLPAQSPQLHVVLLVGLCVVSAASALVTAWRRPEPRPTARITPESDRVARVTCACFIASLLVMWMLAALIPMTQNDALEYAIVGREIFAARDLRVYPLLDPASSASGFFGPWTHPPLYVSLVYMAFALQGDDAGTLAVRLVSPWFFTAAALLVASLGALRGGARGAFFAGMVFLAAPLTYLGAASSLIDPLPVLGLALVLAAAVGLEARPWHRGAWIGAALGLALWTHSVAVIFPFLAAPALWLTAWMSRPPAHRLPGAAKEATAMLLTAAAIGVWPYVRNMMLFGSPVSDNPAVFAFPSLDWKSYFTVMRGIGTTAEMVQYGLLKGWFAIESYSLTFWLALPGIALAWRAVRSSTNAGARAAAPRGEQGLAESGAVALGNAALMSVVYHGLVLVSVLLGVDVMVRNERYMLVIMPCVALLGAAALAPAGSTRLPRWLIVALAALTFAQLATMMVYRGWPALKVAASGGTHLDWWGPIGVQRQLRRLPPAPKVLTLKPADMFYSRQRMLSYLDPSMLDFYRLGNAAEAARWLRDRGVTHVHVPDYWLPPLYNSALQELLATDVLAELVEDQGGYQLYRLRDGSVGLPAATECGAMPFERWRRSEELVFGGRKSMLRMELGSQRYSVGDESRSWNESPAFLRESSTVLRSDEVPLPAAHNEWLIEMELAGDGYVLVYVMAHGGSTTRPLATRLLADMPLRTQDPPRKVQRRIRLPEGTVALSLSVEHRGSSRLRLASARANGTCPG